MPAKRSTQTKPKARRRCCRVLLVEASAEHRPALERCGTERRPLSVVHAPTLAEARLYLEANDVDLAVIDPALPDGDGFDLAAEVARDRRTTATIVFGATADFVQAQRALRAGADDYLAADAQSDEWSARIDAALDRKSHDIAAEQRIDRLQKLCKKLNRAREDVSSQVDILCNDLVTAYQELACQMQNVVQSTQYSDLVKDELDLEALLRRTLEHLMEKVGPANAAIFLPASMDEYSLGGYVNYDCSAAAADLLLTHLADHLAPRVAVTDDLVHLTDPEMIQQWAGDAPHAMDTTGLVAVPCMHGEECLAVLVLFRDLDLPFTDDHLGRMSSLAPLLGSALEKIIRVHHRSVFNAESMEHDDDGDAMPF